MTLLKLFESLNTEDLFTFFKKQDYVTLHLKENDFVALRTMKITGTSLLNCEKKDLMETLTWGTAIEIFTLKNKVSSGKVCVMFWVKLVEFKYNVNLSLVIEIGDNDYAKYRKLESLIINQKVS